MRYRPLGATGVEVSEIGFGTSRLGGVFAGGSPADTVALLHAALDAGITFYDTADMYSQGEAESLLGRAFRDRRDRVFIATKGGYCLPAQRRWVAGIKPLLRPVIRALKLRRPSVNSAVRGELSQDFSPDYLTAAAEASLRRLRTDRIDLYQLHSPPAALIGSAAIDDSIAALEALRQQGKVRFYGVAADSVAEGAPALKAPGIASVQLPYGLLDPEAAESVLSDAAEGRLGVIARGCFGGGLLKETLEEEELREMTPKWPAILALRRAAEAAGRPLLDLALRYALDSPGVSVALLGMRTQAHLESSLRLYRDALPLTADERTQIADALKTLPGGHASASR